jgi:hypothetical protein
LDIKVFDIIDARCNLEDQIFLPANIGIW